MLNFKTFNTRTKKESGVWVHVKLPNGELAYLESDDKGNQIKPCRIKVIGADSTAYNAAVIRYSRAARKDESEVAKAIREQGQNFKIETATDEEVLFAFSKVAENRTVRAALLTTEMENIILPADVAKEIGVKVSKAGHVVIDTDNLVAFYSAFDVIEKQVLAQAESDENFILA